MDWLQRQLDYPDGIPANSRWLAQRHHRSADALPPYPEGIAARCSVDASRSVGIPWNPFGIQEPLGPRTGGDAALTTGYWLGPLRGEEMT